MREGTAPGRNRGGALPPSTPMKGARCRAVIESTAAPLRRDRGHAVTVTRPAWGVATVPNAWTFDTSIGSDAFRLRVLLAADTVQEETEEDDLCTLLGWSRARLDAAARDLAAAGYLIPRIGGGWEVA